MFDRAKITEKPANEIARNLRGYASAISDPVFATKLLAAAAELDARGLHHTATTSADG